MTTDRWDVEAKADQSNVLPSTTKDPNTVSEMDLMLQSLLEDRFRLKLHRETQTLPLYIVTVAKDGLKLRPVAPPSPFSDQTPPVAPPVGKDGGQPPGTFNMTQPGLVVGSALSVPQIILVISQLVGRTVTDKTDLNGNFDVLLRFDPQSVPGAGPSVGPAGASDPAAPSIFTAIQEQLGLKLESTSGPVEVLVVDSAQKPTEN